MNTLAPSVTFTPSPLGTETVRLGDKVIGHLMAVQDKARSAPHAAVLLLLPDIPRKQLPAPSMDAARHIARREIEDWLRGAGLTERGRA